MINLHSGVQFFKLSHILSTIRQTDCLHWNYLIWAGCSFWKMMPTEDKETGTLNLFPQNQLLVMKLIWSNWKLFTFKSQLSILKTVCNWSYNQNGLCQNKQVPQLGFHLATSATCAYFCVSIYYQLILGFWSVMLGAFQEMLLVCNFLIFLKCLVFRLLLCSK